MKRHPRLRILLAIVLAGTLVPPVAATVLVSVPSACKSCHATVVEARSSASHHDVGCSSCHSSGPAETARLSAVMLTRMLPARIAGRTTGGPVTEIPGTACRTCHDTRETAIVSGPTGLRIRHSTCAEDASCDRCHATVAHGAAVRWQRGPVMDDCVGCHKARHASVECDSCHAAKKAEVRTTTGPWQVTHGASWEKTHGMGALTSCATCHPRDYCVRCHKVSIPHEPSFGRDHGKAAAADLESCITCHKSEAYCRACHGLEMPHPGGFIKTHARTARGHDDPTCLRCHPPESCVDCHDAHVHPGFYGVKKTAETTKAGVGR